MKGIARTAVGLGRALSWLVVGLFVLWVAGALWHDVPFRAAGKVLAVFWVVGAVAVPVVVRPGWRAMLVIVLAGLGVGGWWATLQPRQDRKWKSEVARLARVKEEGDGVVIENVRNFGYRSETDFSARYETRRYRFANFRGADLFVNYWGSAMMAHPIVSFDFGEDGRVCFSIETRPEKGESYSAVGGLYRQFELIYVVADEKDVIGVRALHRVGEDVYLYHLHAPQALEWFREYVNTVNALYREPRWYHALTNNCTTAMRQQHAAEKRAPWDWRMLANGYADEMLYDRKVLDQSLPFEELKKRSRINERAKAAAGTEDFSARIRVGLPGM